MSEIISKLKEKTDGLNDFHNEAGCKVENYINEFFEGSKDKNGTPFKEAFIDGMYSSKDCQIINKRMEVLENGELKKEDVTGIVLHQTNGQTALSTMGRYHMDNAKKAVVENNIVSTIFGRYSVEGIGAHFLISPSGTIYQTARVDRMCYHVGAYLNSPCFKNRSCGKEQNEQYQKIMDDKKLKYEQKLAAITAEEIKKHWAERYSKNSDSIGIEVVGMPVNDVYPKPSTQQMTSTKWLVDLLLAHFKLTKERLFAHGQISPHKNPTEGMTILSAFQDERGSSIR